MRVYNGTSWQNFSTFGITDYIYTASAAQTSFTGADDNANTLTFDSSSNVFGVFQNGVRLIEGAGNDYTIGTNTVTLTSGAALDDLVVIQVATNFDVSGAISQATADTRYLKKTDDLSDMYTPTKGNLLVGNGTSFVEVGVGTDGYRLEADSTDAEGLVWASPYPKWVHVPNASVGTGHTYTSAAFDGTVETVIIAFSGLSLSGTEEPVLALATGGTPTLTRSGYLAETFDHGSSITNYTTGFVLTGTGSAATDSYSGTLTLKHTTGNAWIISGTVMNDSLAAGESYAISGKVTLAGALTGIGFSSESAAGVDGTDLLDGGNVTIDYMRSA